MTQKLSRHCMILAAALSLGGTFASSLSAQSVSTRPVGAVTVAVAPSTNGTSYTVSQISAPLLASPLVPGPGVDPIAPTGLLRATVSSLTATTLTSSTAGWTVNQLNQVGYPIFVRILSGAASGRTLLITSNTVDTLTVDNQGTDLTTLGMVVGASGDSYELVAGDTLLGLLGTPADGVIGGTSAQFAANQVDKVSLNVGGSLFTYYYSTTNNRWTRSGSGASQNNVVISPQSGVSYQRISTAPLSLTVLGSVPVGPSKTQVSRLGVSILSRQFPTDTTLAGLAMDQVPGWKKANAGGVTVATSDRVMVKVGTSLFSYFYDATTSTWKRSGSGADQGGVLVSAGAGLRIQRSGTAGSDTWNLAPNYTL